MTITTSMPNLFTSDIDAAVGFYRDLLGFAEAYRFPAEGTPWHVVLILGETRLALSDSRAIRQVGLAPSRGNTFELVLSCTDVDEEAARLRASGATVIIAPYNHISGHRRTYLADPDHNWIALVDI